MRGICFEGSSLRRILQTLGVPGILQCEHDDAKADRFKSISHSATLAKLGQLRAGLILNKQWLFRRYPDLPNRPDKTFGFNPGNSGNPDTKEIFPVYSCPGLRSGGLGCDRRRLNFC
jgi:hypothetical protein